MPLILGDEGLDLGQFPDLVSQGRGVGPGQRAPTPPTVGRHERHDLVARFDGEKGSGMLGVAGLTTPLLSRPRALRCRSGVGMLGAGWQGRVLGRRRPVGELGLEVADLGSELVDLRREREDERPHGGGHLDDEFRGKTPTDGSRHADKVAEKAKSDQINCAECERLRDKGSRSDAKPKTRITLEGRR
jgi:hypothetical protein